MVVGLVDIALRITAPVPLTKLMVDEVVLDVLPGVETLLECSLVTKVLVDVIESYDGFGLYPPVAVIIDVAGIYVGFVSHAAVGVKTLFAGCGYELYDRFDLSKYLLVAEDESGFVHEPRTLNVMTIRFEPAGTTGPIHLEEEVEVVGLRIEDAVGEDVDEVTESCFDNI